MSGLTKDADKIICCIYKEYLERRKSESSKSEAKEFEDNFYQDIKSIANWDCNDISDTLRELQNAGFLKVYITNDFSINDEAIVYMENRFKNGLAELTDFISKFIP